ncbi:hypothetical protein [Sedimentitalea nanhaiensis]|uniref:Uncharacterized protein n=1 Tax=Sedimentitalea nanhaiensis TaxID=999627 RepID=A0A1I7E251_9RHOB|nr:hypothetical protein [Sedimentitalea nanhaiensis]SFU17923.1 hypothetical protein SAMN05216236_14116 [Sedimentitalea nanhaiensis]
MRKRRFVEMEIGGLIKAGLPTAKVWRVCELVRADFGTVWRDCPSDNPDVCQEVKAIISTRHLFRRTPDWHA